MVGFLNYRALEGRNRTRQQAAKGDIMSSGIANKIWCQTHPEKRRENQKRYITSTKGIYFRLKNQAREHHRNFNITLEEYLTWLNRQPRVCHYCGKILISHGHNGDCQTVDRIDNNEGYELANMVLACVSCNTKKGNKEGMALPHK